MATAHEWVADFLARAEGGLDVDRLVEDAPALDAQGIIEILGDERLGPERVIQAMSDLMHPTDSMYFDAIFGAFHGQVAIRNWLVPTMSDISFIEFVPTADGELFSHDGGTSSIDEWQMWANLGNERRPLQRGVSTRHYADGWVTWNADVYDTTPMRRPPSDDTGDSPPPLPPAPRPSWSSEPMTAPTKSPALEEWLEAPADQRGPLDHADIHAIMVSPELGLDPGVVAALWHPTDSRLFERDQEIAGAAAIVDHLAAKRSSRTQLRLERVGPLLFNGSCTAFEWLAWAPDAAHPLRGTSVCRYRDGHVVYAADYYDTAELS